MQNATPSGLMPWAHYVDLLGKDGSFELLLSPTRPAGYDGNWWRLPPEAKSILSPDQRAEQLRARRVGGQLRRRW